MRYSLVSTTNKGVRTGDLVRAYATYYEGDGWVLRRLWCDECGASTIGQGPMELMG